MFKKEEPETKSPDQAVIVRVPLSDDASGTLAEFDHFVALEERLEAAIDEAGAGEFDGNEIGEGEFTYFRYAQMQIGFSPP